MNTTTSRCLLFGALLLPLQVYALTFVNFDIQFDDSVTDIYLELYDEQVPVNTSNFLGYVNRSDYDDSFIHRRARYTSGPRAGERFVLQGGGFSYVPEFDLEAERCDFSGILKPAYEETDTTGELGLRPIGELYFFDLDEDNDPDSVGSGDGMVDAVIRSIQKYSCAEIGDLYRVNDGLNTVPIDTASLPVLGEPGISNLRGTIAMALSGGPDTATSQWYFNMSDNTSLDTNFTVFGQVIGDGMTFLDTVFDTVAVSSLAGQAINSAFGELPLINYETLLVRDHNLVKIKSAKEILSIDVSSHDFGYIASGNSAQVVITLSASSQWESPVIINGVEDTDTLAAPFTLNTDCDGTTLSPGTSCTVTIDFDPVTESSYEDAFNISFTDPPLPNLIVPISGNSQLLPQLVADTDTINYQFVFPGLTKVKTVDLTNEGQQLLTINTIALDNTEDYAVSDDCGSALAFGESCKLTITFQPNSSGIKLGMISIDSNSEDSPTNILLVGAGSGDVIPEIDTVDTLEMGDTNVSGSLTDFIEISNLGGTELTITDISIAGTNASDFSITDSDCDTVAINDSCTLTLNYASAVIGQKEAEIRITSDDPDETVLVISLFASTGSDVDTVPDAVESAAPSAGDGNLDGTQDLLQSHVASYPDSSGEYITIITDPDNSIVSAKLLPELDPASLPQGVEFVDGVLAFKISGSSLTGVYEAGLLLPRNRNIDKIYLYGSTADDSTPHWFEASIDATTGAGVQDLGNVALENGTDRVYKRLVTLQLIDGVDGDSDLVVDNSLVVQVAYTRKSGGSNSSSLDAVTLLLVLALIIIARLRTRYCTAA